MTPLESELAVPTASVETVETKDLRRFTGTERALHWTTATLVLTVAITGLILYVGQLSALVGRRDILKNVHVISGLAMPVPLVLAYAGHWRNSVRADVRRLSRWVKN